jgi:DNA polymerase III delta prime subunit
LVRAKEIFKEYFNLKRREFWEDSFDASLEQRILTYKQMHNEINFIFETCEKHNNLQKNPIYSYLKEWIYNKSGEIWKNMRFYETINKKFLKYKFFSKFTIVGLFY